MAALSAGLTSSMRARWAVMSSTEEIAFANQARLLRAGERGYRASLSIFRYGKTLVRFDVVEFLVFATGPVDFN